MESCLSMERRSIYRYIILNDGRTEVAIETRVTTVNESLVLELEWTGNTGVDGTTFLVHVYNSFSL